MEGKGGCVRNEGVDEGKEGVNTIAGEEEKVEKETEKQEAEEE